MLLNILQRTNQLLTAKSVPAPNVRRAEVENPLVEVKIKPIGVHVFFFAVKSKVFEPHDAWPLPGQQSFCPLLLESSNGSRLFMLLDGQNVSVVT